MEERVEVPNGPGVVALAQGTLACDRFLSPAALRRDCLGKPTCAIQGESIQGKSPEGGLALLHLKQSGPGADLFVVLGISTHCALSTFTVSSAQ